MEEMTRSGQQRASSLVTSVTRSGAFTQVSSSVLYNTTHVSNFADIHTEAAKAAEQALLDGGDFPGPRESICKNPIFNAAADAAHREIEKLREVQQEKKRMRENSKAALSNNDIFMNDAPAGEAPEPEDDGRFDMIGTSGTVLKPIQAHNYGESSYHYKKLARESRAKYDAGKRVAKESVQVRGRVGECAISGAADQV